mmetsp:Transcript_56137/g.89350  ORF Transcript_56137/g.89350 Transcript_56137/m.89350 type:complete len:182 (-) Transcript_56137:260-805(-)
MGNIQRNNHHAQHVHDHESMPWQQGDIVLPLYDYDDGEFQFKADDVLIVVQEGKDETVLVRIAQTDRQGFVDWHEFAGAFHDAALQTESPAADDLDRILEQNVELNATHIQIAYPCAECDITATDPAYNNCTLFGRPRADSVAEMHPSTQSRHTGTSRKWKKMKHIHFAFREELIKRGLLQ